jgi:hypothetical protein
MGALRQHTGGPGDDTINLHLWPGGRGELDWYEDDGVSMQHLADGFHRRRIHWNGRSLELGGSEGSLPSQVKRWRVILRNARSRVRVSGVRARVRHDRRAALLSFEMRNIAGKRTVTLG